jgi:hypothetical protein
MLQSGLGKSQENGPDMAAELSIDKSPTLAEGVHPSLRDSGPVDPNPVGLRLLSIEFLDNRPRARAVDLDVYSARAEELGSPISFLRLEMGNTALVQRH